MLARAGPGTAIRTRLTHTDARPRAAPEQAQLPIFIPGQSLIGSVATLESSSVTCPEKPGSIHPAVECVSRPSLPRLELCVGMKAGPARNWPEVLLTWMHRTARGLVSRTSTMARERWALSRWVNLTRNDGCCSTPQRVVAIFCFTGRQLSPAASSKTASAADSQVEKTRTGRGLFSRRSRAALQRRAPLLDRCPDRVPAPGPAMQPALGRPAACPGQRGLRPNAGLGYLAGPASRTWPFHSPQPAATRRSAPSSGPSGRAVAALGRVRVTQPCEMSATRDSPSENTTSRQGRRHHRGGRDDRRRAPRLIEDLIAFGQLAMHRHPPGDGMGCPPRAPCLPAAPRCRPAGIPPRR